MPIIYLSPSTQEGNLYVPGGSEEYYMNLIADAMVPYLRSNGIQYVRNTPDMTAGQAIRASNAGNYDFHLALHSNAAPESRYGQKRGVEVYYDPRSYWGKKAAEIIAKNLKLIYPLPDQVSAIPTRSLGEVDRTKAPAVLIEFAYHDNVDDANWIINNVEKIASNVAYSLTEYFGIPFIQPAPPRPGIVSTQSTALNVRSRPSTSAAVIGRLYPGQQVTVWGEWEDWYVVEADDLVGYAASRYIRF